MKLTKSRLSRIIKEELSKALIERDMGGQMTSEDVKATWYELIGGCAGLSSAQGQGGMLEAIRALLDALSEKYGREVEESEIDKRDLYPGYNREVALVELSFDQNPEHPTKTVFMLVKDLKSCQSGEQGNLAQTLKQIK